jgi:DNA-binding transcriptional regulator YhcF (GntR family)
MTTADLVQFLPRYHQIKESLRAELARLPPESRLPTIRALRDRFEASQTTMDRALRELEKEGLIRREHGRGMFVTGPATPQRLLTLAPCDRQDALEERLTTRAVRRFEGAERTARVTLRTEPAEGADVLHLNTLSFLRIASQLLPLDEWLSPALLDRFDPRALAPFQLGGRTLALPKLYSPWVLYYRCEAFDEADLPYPTSEWTWVDLLAASRRLTQPSGGRFGFAALPGFRCRLPYIWQNGGELFDEASGACRLTAAEVVEALEFWAELEASSPLTRETTTPERLYELFLAGRLAMFPWGGRLRALAALKPDCRWGVTLLPQGRQRATLLVAEAYGVSRESANVEAALRLAEALVSPTSLREQLAAGYPLVADGEIQAHFPVEPAFAASLAWARVTREYRFHDEMRVIENEFSRAWQRGEPVAATCRRVQDIVLALMESRAARSEHRELY